MINLINGNPQNLSGLIVPNGSVTFQLNIDATVVAAPYGFVGADAEIVFAFNTVGQIQPNGSATYAQIYSNAELNPQNSSGLGTYYLVTFYDANGCRLNKNPMWWQFPQAANATVDIGEVAPYATVGGNVIFYPTDFTVGPPGLSTLGGVFSNIGAANEWISAINTDGTVVLSQPAFANLSGAISYTQFPSGVLGTGAVVLASAVSAQISGSITAGQVAFGSGTSTIAGSAYLL